MNEDPSSRKKPVSVKHTEPLMGLELRSCISSRGMLELTLEQVEQGNLLESEVIVRVEATPLNPSDIGLLFGPADLSEAKECGTDERPCMTAPVSAVAMDRLGTRIDKSLVIGNEGAGVVIRAGAQASDLLGKTVSMVGGGMYTHYRRIHRDDCMVLDDDITPAEGAAAFVNPLTALGMVETMRREGHQALVHTAAASSLGQMLIKLCSEEGIALVNIVRSESQVKLLKDLGARHVLNSTSLTFEVDLLDALVQTRATLCFDALSGGPVAGTVLDCMEQALGRLTSGYQRYGSTTHKQIYMYGILDPRPIVLPRVGMAWGVGGVALVRFPRKNRAYSGATATRACQQGAAYNLRDALQSADFVGGGVEAGHSSNDRQANNRREVPDLPVQRHPLRGTGLASCGCRVIHRGGIYQF